MSLLIALDIGGTFTDLIAFDLATGTIRQAKSSTTPYDLAEGIRDTLGKSGLSMASAERFIHGSTVAINTAIERTGARTALAVTEGTRDVYRIGRGNRPEAYNLFFKRPEPYVPRHRTLEIVGRLSAAGEVLVELDRPGAEAAARRLAGMEVESIAVCFLHSWANPAQEAEVGKLLRAGLPAAYVSLSHEILREYREYERTSTTVLNAYVGPRVSRYLKDLESLLRAEGFAGQLLVMQSNGGTMSPEIAQRIPVATMESGPVGGIIAAAEVGRSLGCADVIAFDMGGTTAKVSLVRDHRPEIAQGYYIGGAASGHPVMFPVVDIVEVGAGGGSIAWIDAVGALKVGPRSAGGHPGPVCYGLGGAEPTVTDANAVLGRLGARRFLGGEMPLEIGAAREAIRNKIALPLGLGVEEAALDIIRIASAEMSRAVRSVSVGKGYDPRDFALVAFGGAGPLHAAEIARELHIPTMVIPRVPGHFSALGMLIADLRHDYVRTYYRALDAADFDEMNAMFEAMIAEGGALLASEGAAPDRMTFDRYLDIRYVGQEFPIATPVSAQELAGRDPVRLRNAFDLDHDRRYGHHAAEEPVEIVNLRLTATARRQRAQFPGLPGKTADALIERSPVILNDPARAVDCPVYDRERLGAGFRIAGPAAIVEYASTTILFDGDTLEVAPGGELIVQLAPLGLSASAQRAAGTARLDPVTLEVLRNAFPAIADDMSIDLQRTSYNMMIYEVRDYCCALVDVQGRLISQNIGGVSHFVSDLGVVIKDAVARYGRDGFSPGDVLIMNHQRVAGQHLNNVCIFTPFFFEGELQVFAVVRAHWGDVGGLSTGFGAINLVNDPWMEGLQLDQLKLYEAGIPDRKLLQVIRDNIRFPDSAMGDLRSQLAACKLAERRLQEVFERYGRDTVFAAIERIFDDTEAKCRQVVRAIPDGEYRAESFFDPDGHAPGETVPIRARVVVRGDEMIIDLTETSLERRSAINSRTLAAPYIAYKGLTGPVDPVNEGSFRALRVDIQEGNLMMARYPAVMAGWSRVLPTVVDTILRALAPALPDRIPAAHLGTLGGSLTFVGYDPARHRDFVLQTIEGGGWGARPWEDGESASVSVCQGDVRNAPIETIELKVPVMVERRTLRNDSGGPGKYRGGLGQETHMRNLVPGRWSLSNSGRRMCPPWGLAGGGPGAASRNMLRSPGEREFKVTDPQRTTVEAGACAAVLSAGGGGWGDPLERDPAAVRADVVEEFVSLASARDDYGVVIDPSGREIDREATMALRVQLRAERAARA